MLSGAGSYGFTNESKKVSVSDEEAVNGKASVTLVVEQKQTYDYAGTITGFGEDVDATGLQLIMVADESSMCDDVKLTVNKEDYSFSGKLESDVNYTITLEGVNDYEVTGEKTVKITENKTDAQITVAKKTIHEITGSFVDLDGTAITGVTALSFKNVEDEYTYNATVTDSGYTIRLRDGAYVAVATIENYSTSTHVVVEGSTVTKDLLFVSTATEGALTRVADLYVGYSDEGDANYETVSEAVKAAKRMNPSSESERITIHIAPGTYREQIIVDAPYVTFTNDEPSKEVKLTWYYGIGYKYYSVDSTGYYNAERAYDKYQKNEGRIDPEDVDRWGCAVKLNKTANYFKAENIVFENSFNRYITEEELADGVEPLGSYPVRNRGTVATSKAATERAAAIYIADADNVEFYQCSFLSSQDTLGTGGDNVHHAYFKNCFIEGNTDYICGDGDMVFDNCELSFAGYSDSEKKYGGYITAAKADAAANGYLFWGCTVTGNDKLTVTPGYFGRPWTQNAKVTFVNTKLETADIITAAGWTNMSNSTASGANFKEYNTTSLDGKAIDFETSPRKDKVVKELPVSDMTVYFGDWTPSYYTPEDATVEISGELSINDDCNLSIPKPGHILSVEYSLGENNSKNDASIIKWYRVKSGQEDILVKNTTATVSRSYTIQTEDVGSKIKVVVTPATTSGKTGTAKEATVSDDVQPGYETAEKGEVVLGSGVNIFLAGDSTVKDYSGTENLGSWGEYIQSFFDDEQVTIVNYANGGRSSRSFINEGSLDAISKDIKEGDYLFIQFGHNDCSNGSNYLVDRYVPLASVDFVKTADNSYPVTAGTKSSTAGLSDKLKNSYGDEYYAYDCGGTYKWYLKQYIEVAKKVNAIPVLVTPVSRMYYQKDGTIKTHHDSTDATTNTYVSSENAYVTACKELASEENVILIDAFTLTKNMYEAAYKADTIETVGVSTYGTQLMGEKLDDGVMVMDATHSNKLGGFISAGIFAKAILAENGLSDLATAIKAPANVGGYTTTNETVFEVTSASKLTAYSIIDDYASEADYWTAEGQKLIDEIAKAVVGN